MKRNESVLYILNITLRLMAVCCVIAVLVATVNYFASPVIDENNKKATKNAISNLFYSEDIAYEPTEGLILPDEHKGTVDAVYSVKGTENEHIGYCVELSPTGFKGEVDLIVAFDTDGFIKGVEIISTNDETSGIGTKVKDRSFTDQFIESADETVSTDASKYIIAQATKTSKPVSQSIITAKGIINDFLSNKLETIPEEKEDSVE
ncbi:MAG: FMN-binding protein [Ruminococcaceae bacterium]|nr:FMN-binding protein [Oscillospiraceae bacterium]